MPFVVGIDVAPLGVALVTGVAEGILQFEKAWTRECERNVNFATTISAARCEVLQKNFARLLSAQRAEIDPVLVTLTC